MNISPFDEPIDIATKATLALVAMSVTFLRRADHLRMRRSPDS
jgi:hypothetical protein